MTGGYYKVAEYSLKVISPQLFNVETLKKMKSSLQKFFGNMLIKYVKSFRNFLKSFPVKTMLKLSNKTLK